MGKHMALLLTKKEGTALKGLFHILVKIQIAVNERDVRKIETASEELKRIIRDYNLINVTHKHDIAYHQEGFCDGTNCRCDYKKRIIN